MNVRVSRSVPVLIAIASFGLAACDSNGSEGSAGSLTGPSSFPSILVTAEPAKITPEFLSSPSCLAHPAFRGRLSVTVRSEHEHFLRHMRFTFRDRFGNRAFPTAVPIPSISSMTIPKGTPVPIPTSSPIPIPGHVPFGGTLVSSSLSHTQAFLLFFGCGHRAFGTLFIEVETTDRGGTIDASLTSVDVEDDDDDDDDEDD